MPKKSAQKVAWKINQSDSKKKKKIKLAVTVLVLIFAVILLGQIVRVGKVLVSPWNFPQEAKNYQWDDRFNINLVIKAKSIAVLSLNPAEKQATIINLPDNTFTEVAGGFGKWQLRSVYGLGQSEGNRGSVVLKQTISAFLGIPVDGFLEFDGDLAGINPSDLVQKYHQSLFSGITDIGNIRTDLTPLELARLKFKLTGVRFDKIQSIDLSKTGILDSQELSDGTKVYVGDSAKLDTVLSEFIDPVVRGEGTTVAVLNATDHPQLAQKAARLIANLGGSVIITSNAEKTYRHTQVLGKKSPTLVRLTQIFDLGCKKSLECDKIDSSVETSRAQINIILGEDFYLSQ